MFSSIFKRSLTSFDLLFVPFNNWSFKMGMSTQVKNEVFTKIVENHKQHQRTNDQVNYNYGTAGFREKSHLLDHIMYRMGIVSSLRSKFLNSTIGLIITASHNPEEDNGIKLVDPFGEMLELEWEILSTKLVNLPDEEFGESIIELIEKYKINVNTSSNVFIGRDTRESSPRLFNSAVDGISSLVNSHFKDFGKVTTPIIHYVTTCENTKHYYGLPTLEGYYDKLSNAFKNLIGSESSKGYYIPKIKLDGANGVGSLAIKEFKNRINSNILNIETFNDGSGRLNYNCGADYVKIEQKPPENFGPIEIGTRYISIDGDADRIIYFYFDTGKNFRILDGDKIATLFAEHLEDLVKKSALSLKLGVVQTAYANGSSTNYIHDTLGIEISCVATGVKHLHAEAHKFDIGIYFEANGHGTVTFSTKAVNDIKKSASEQNTAGKELSHFLDLINSTNGDAISDLLTVEAILHSKGWSIEDWDSKYTDLPNRQMKVKIKDRNIIKTGNAERIVLEPFGFQDQINSLQSKYSNGRSFVRPSGTEDIVRIYAEAKDKQSADRLCNEVASVCFSLCGGVASP